MEEKLQEDSCVPNIPTIEDGKDSQREHSLKGQVWVNM